MKRGTPEKRRWENGLRRGARASDTSTSVRRRSGPVVETKRSGGNAAATAALQAYLFTDKDARTRIPRPAVATADVVHLNRTEEIMIRPKESEMSMKIREPVDIESEDIATAHDAATSRAESPLSRFQKYVKQVQSMPDQRGNRELSAINPQGNISALKPPVAQTLTRSLMDKVEEAKGLRYSEASSKYQTNCHRDPGDRCRSSSPSAMNDTCTEPVYKANFHTLASTVALSSSQREHQSLAQSSTLSALKNAPPVPHAKPVMPVISTFPPLPTPKKPVSIINGVIEAANAALLIQRMWRRKLASCREQKRGSERNEVTLIIDKHVESVTPLFSAVKMSCQTNDVSKARADDVAAISAVGDEVVGICSSMKAAGGLVARSSSYDPWTDQDLIFLEEGRCIGELQEAVRRRTSMDQDELVWKRPQHVIQQLETRRVSTIQKTRRKRAHRRKPQLLLNIDPQVETPGTTEKLVPIQTPKQLCTETANNTLLTGKKLRREVEFPHVRLLKHRISKGKVALRAGRIPSKTRRLFTRVDQAHTKLSRVSNSTNQPQAGDRSDSNQADNDMANDHRDETLKTDPSSDPQLFDRFVVFSNSKEMEDAMATKPLRNDLICVGDLALARSLLYEKRHPLSSDIVDHPNDFIPFTLAPTNPPENEHPDEQESIEGQLLWHSERYTQVDMSATEDFAQGVSASTHSTGSNASTDSCTAKDAVTQRLSQSTADPMIALNVMKSAVTKTMTRIHCKYREEAPHDDHQPASNQLLEAAPIIPVAQLRLDEDKRIEFLRALNDFKRCLQLSSCASSTMSLQGSTSLQRANATVKANVLSCEPNIQSEAVDVALGSYGNSDSDL
ncbi:hypothetical protein V7S43_014758 [Phytophthora oleae]|uniref:Uncharacterized protein n=1 Tax=Phytophthora oleae TaxID=2107226 RepID=A0ABD3F095_9STRA